MESPKTLTIRKPDDWHVHFRNVWEMMRVVIPPTARRFGRVLAMTNFTPLIQELMEGRKYCHLVRRAAGGRHAFPSFRPYLSYYLTPAVDVHQLRFGFEEGIFLAAKLMWTGATTGSEFGVRSRQQIYPALTVMEKIGMPLAIHGQIIERGGVRVDPYDREPIFFGEELPRLRSDFPGLKISVEHLSTRVGASYVEGANDPNLVGTITAHHLWISREDLHEGGLCGDYHCLPPVAREEDRLALRKAATSGKSCFFLGSDSAPHLLSSKRSHCSPGGIWTGHAALELYTHVFEEEAALDRLENFASVYGAQFYDLPPNTETIILERIPWTVDVLVPVGKDGFLWPFLYEEKPENRPLINWRLKD